MARAPGVVRHGTAKQNAEHATGYSANGESMHSRQVAHVNIKLGEGRRTSGRLIREQSGALAKLKYRMTVETDEDRLRKIRKDIAIKSKFVAKLKKQYASEHPGEQDPAPTRAETNGWNWEDVTTLPGEDAFEPWNKKE